MPPWAAGHHAIPTAVHEAINKQRQEIRELATNLAEPRVVEPTGRERAVGVAQPLLKLALALDLHVERYDSEVLPAIRRAAFHR